MDFTNFNTSQSLWDLFQQEGSLPAKVHPTLAGSWKRSRQYGVDPYLESAPATAATFPQDEREEILLEVARPYFQYFGKLLVVSDCALSLSNARGVIVYLEGQVNQTIKRLTEKHNFLVGGEWAEKSAGTNAIGMAIEERTNILLQGVEHYSYGFHPYSCAASPMFDRATGEIIGVVDASTYSGYLNLHSMGWVAAMARLIEADFNKKVVDLRSCRTPTGKTSRHYFHANPLQQDRMKLLGGAPSFLFALDTARRVAGTGLNVLLTGETGSGKEVFARAIHHYSSRSESPFVAVNCAAIPGDLVYSELFGYTEGAFTGASRRGHPGRFEQADGGTIFLDEVGDAPNEVQVGLLRVLEEKVVCRLGSAKSIPVDVRVLAATSRDLQALVAGGRFREDLYYRLAGINIKIPALRDRREDIPLLAEYFLGEAAGRAGRSLYIDGRAMEALLEYDWPGNVRELKNLMDRLAVLVDGPAVTIEALLQWGTKNIARRKDKSHPEKERLLNTIKEAGGNITRVAELLGVNRTTVYRRLKKYGIST
ncbi:MAG: sigma-54-dependent Fis family transcriptional regulator [Bacillota bacterium]